MFSLCYSLYVYAKNFVIQTLIPFGNPKFLDLVSRFQTLSSAILANGLNSEITILKQFHSFRNWEFTDFLFLENIYFLECHTQIASSLKIDFDNCSISCFWTTPSNISYKWPPLWKVSDFIIIRFLLVTKIWQDFQIRWSRTRRGADRLRGGGGLLTLYYWNWY